MSRTWWLCALCLLGAAASAQQPQPVELPNPGFEGKVTDGVPAGWEHARWSRVQGRLVVTDERACEGDRSVCLEAEKGEGCVLFSTLLPCYPGDRFIATCRLYNEESHASLYVKFRYGSLDMTARGQYEYTIEKTVGEWTQVSVEATAPPLADHVHVDLYVPMGAFGKHYFDAVTLSVTPGPREEVTKMLEVGGKKQLFVDAELIESREGMELVLHQGEKHPANPLLRCERPWEGWRMYLYGSAMYDEDEGLFKMWYLVGGKIYCTCYATSTDGVHWERPALNLPEFAQYGEGNNIVCRPYLASVMKDNDDPDPERRYKMVCWDGSKVEGAEPDSKGRVPRYGYSSMVSPDGIHWQRHIPTVAPGGDVITACYDPGTGRFIAIPKTGARVGAFGRRSFQVMTSEDFDTWTEPVLSIAADEQDDQQLPQHIEAARPILQAPDDPDLMRTELYGVGIMPYESVYLGFPWVFYVNNNSLWSGNQEGPITLQLIASRELYRWHRCGGRKQIIRQGDVRSAADRDWDSGMITTAAYPFIHNDRIWLYYGGHNLTHGDSALYRDDPRRGVDATAAIGLATWRLDGFMSASAGEQPGTLTTKPFAFEGERLIINAVARGEVAVELQDEAGQAIEGYQLDACDALVGDELRHIVTWRGKSDVSAFAGGKVRLRLRLRDADLYSFKFDAGE